MLARTEITDDELATLERQLDKIVSDHKGRMTLFDRWGKYKLAYPVRKNVYGIYILSRYQVPSESVTAFFKEIDTLFRIKYNEIVMRHVTVRLPEDAPSVYARPEPVSSHRTSNLDSFIKENKMEGLIDTPVEKKAGDKKPAKEEPVAAEEKPAQPGAPEKAEPAPEAKPEPEKEPSQKAASSQKAAPSQTETEGEA